MECKKVIGDKLRFGDEQIYAITQKIDKQQGPVGKHRQNTLCHQSPPIVVEKKKDNQVGHN